MFDNVSQVRTDSEARSEAAAPLRRPPASNPTLLTHSLANILATLSPGQRLAAALPDAAMLDALERRGAVDDIIFGLGGRLWALTGEIALAPDARTFLHLGELMALLRVRLASTPDSSIRFGDRLSAGAPRAWWHQDGQCRAIVVLPANAVAVLADCNSPAAPHLADAAERQLKSWIAAVDQGAFTLADLSNTDSDHRCGATAWLLNILSTRGIVPAAILDGSGGLHIGRAARDWRDHSISSGILSRTVGMQRCKEIQRA